MLYIHILSLGSLGIFWLGCQVLPFLFDGEDILYKITFKAIMITHLFYDI